MMANRRRGGESQFTEAAEAAEERRADLLHHDKDHDRKHKHKKRAHKPEPKHPGTISERLKAISHQSGQDALNATPGGYPADPANASAVFTTGPGEAVEYNYVRVDGTGSYAPQQSSYTAPVAGHGQVLTPSAAGEMPAGMENNPT